MGESYFQIIGEITAIETIARGAKIRELNRLMKIYGKGRWKKQKGVALIRWRDRPPQPAEIHWYEAHGIGPREFKIKRFLENT